MSSRPITILAAAVVGALFLVGLLLDGAVGGLLLLAVAVLLVALSSTTWPRIPDRGRAVRVAVVVAVLVIAGTKLAG